MEDGERHEGIDDSTDDSCIGLFISILHEFAPLQSVYCLVVLLASTPPSVRCKSLQFPSLPLHSPGNCLRSIVLGQRQASWCGITPFDAGTILLCNSANLTILTKNHPDALLILPLCPPLRSSSFGSIRKHEPSLRHGKSIRHRLSRQMTCSMRS